MKYLRRAGKFSFFLLIFFLPFFFLGIYSFKIEPREALESIKDEPPYDAIIVPGVPFEGDTMGFIMRARVLWAVHLYQTGITRNIIFSGSAVYTAYTESKIMAKYAQAMGVPEENIFTESDAEHSTENVYYSYRLARELDFEKVALATDPVQNLFMKFFIMRKHLDIASVPIAFEVVDSISRELDAISIDPVDAYVEEFVPLPERENSFKRFMGTLGLRLYRNEK